MRILLLSVILLGVVSTSFAQSEDAAGCKDSPLLARRKGCHILKCDDREFAANEFQIGPIHGDNLNTKHLEGKTTWVEYVCPDNKSGIAEFRKAEEVFKKAGYVLVFSGKDNNLQPVVTLRKESQWIQLTSEDQYDQELFLLRGVLEGKQNAPSAAKPKTRDNSASPSPAPAVTSKEVTGEHRGYSNDKLFFRLDDGKKMTFFVAIPGDKGPEMVNGVIKDVKWHDQFQVMTRITVTYHQGPTDEFPVATAIRNAAK
jgi:hypothetical protein